MLLPHGEINGYETGNGPERLSDDLRKNHQSPPVGLLTVTVLARNRVTWFLK
jgi:hypothetical protein